MALVEMLLAGGVAYISINTYQKHRKKSNLIQSLTGVEQIGSSLPSSTTLRKLDDDLQRFVQTKIDPIMFGTMNQTQKQALSMDEEVHPLSKTEKGINRRLAASALLIGTAALAPLAVIPLITTSALLAIYGCSNLYGRAYRSIVSERRINIDFLAALYITGTWIAGYFVFCGIIICVYYLGLKIIFRAENNSRRELYDIFDQQVEFVWQIIDGVETQIPIEQLQADDIIVVHAGEPIPIDGVITEGMASVDQHILTGESQPVEKSIGDLVFATTLMLTGSLYIRVLKASCETSAAQIREILMQTAAHQTQLESKGLEIANNSVVPNILLAGLAWPILGFTSAIAVLSSGLGFNMRTVSLLSSLNYLKIASRNAILVKDGRALEQLHTVDTFVFDKTGTLTLEEPRVIKIHCCQDNLDEDTVLTYAAAAEYRQPHPIAKAIIAAAEERDLAIPQIDDASYEVGYGIKVTIDNQLIRVGSARFMTLEEVAIPETIQMLQVTCQQKGHSLVMVALNNELIGALELHAALRPEAETVITDLRQRGMHVAIISGDQEEPTRAVAQSLDIDDYFANTLPENKALLIEQLQNEGRVVCFIGDGINDAIALKQADVSISLLGATTIATDTAQIVLMDQSLAKLGDLLDLAASFDRTIRQGFWTTMIPGVICIGGVFFLHFGIVAAEILFQIGFFTGLGTAMLPLLREQRQNPDEESSALQSVSAGSEA